MIDVFFHSGLSQATLAGDQAAGEAACSSTTEESENAMQGKVCQQTVVITNPDGLHMRPAANFARWPPVSKVK